MRLLDIRTRARWREWLRRHHKAESEIWLVFHKRATGRKCLSYDGAVEEALCFGWIDSILRSIDQERYARKFTPRKATSVWSSANRTRYARMKAEGLLAPAGLARSPTERDGDPPKVSLSRLPRYIEVALAKRPAARRYFDGLAPSYRRNYIGWIDSAKKPETKARRLQEALTLLAAGKKLGMK
ncbi:MAG: YdeI/OmpD-associated family protein [bacterium]